MCAAAAIIAASYLTDQPEPDNELTGDPAVHQVDLGADVVALLSGMLMAAYYTSMSGLKVSAQMHLCTLLLHCCCCGRGFDPHWRTSPRCSVRYALVKAHIVGFVTFVILLSLSRPHTTSFQRGPQDLSAPSISLILLLELPVGPLYVLTTFGEVPSMVDWIAIGVIVFALAIENVAPLSASRQRASSRLSGRTSK